MAPLGFSLNSQGFNSLPKHNLNTTINFAGLDRPHMVLGDWIPTKS